MPNKTIRKLMKNPLEATKKKPEDQGTAKKLKDLL